MTAAVLVLFGLAALGWLAYDAGDVQRALRLGGVMDEATVALAGLGLAAASTVAGGVWWRRARRAGA